MSFAIREGSSKPNDGTLSFTVRGSSPHVFMTKLHHVLVAVLSSATFGRIQITDVSGSCPLCVDHFDTKDDRWDWGNLKHLHFSGVVDFFV